MGSPFGNYHNARLTVAGTPTGATVNPLTGNLEAVGSEIVYKAYLKPSVPRVQPREGIDRSSLSVSGYLVDPMNFPAGFVLPARLPCEMDTPNGETVTGTLEIGFLPASAFGVEAITGTKLQGTFAVEGL